MTDRRARTSGGKAVALVTGAGLRIGRAIAVDLAAHGHAVALHYRSSEEEARAVMKTIVDAGGRAALVRADLADPVAAERLVAAAADALGGPVLTLVNNASLFEADTLATLTPAGWQAHLSVNTLAPLLLTQALAAALPAGKKANVINMIDQRVWRLDPTFMSYTASKAALWTLTRTTAQALAPYVRVNAIGPGPTLQSTHQSAADFAAEAASVPLERGPDLAEICRAVRFLLETPSMTGQMLALDGGQHLGWLPAAFTESP